MNKTKLEHFSNHFPLIADEMVGYQDIDSDMMVVKLKNGRSVIYDDMDQTVRSVPADCRAMTESQCRSELGIRLRRLLYRKNMTQTELSDITGIQQSLISSYILGKTTPSFFNMDKIAKALNCSLDELRYIE